MALAGRARRRARGASATRSRAAASTCSSRAASSSPRSSTARLRDRPAPRRPRGPAGRRLGGAASAASSAWRSSRPRRSSRGREQVRDCALANAVARRRHRPLRRLVRCCARSAAALPALDRAARPAAVLPRPARSRSRRCSTLARGRRLRACASRAAATTSPAGSRSAFDADALRRAALRLHAAVASSLVSQGDFLRMLAFGVLLVGVWRAIQLAGVRTRSRRGARTRRARDPRRARAVPVRGLDARVDARGRARRSRRRSPRIKEAATLAQQEARFAILALSSASGTAPFDAALRRYVDVLTADGGLEVELEVDRTIRLAPDEQIEIFRIVQEGLANVRKHANATRAEVTIGQRAVRRAVRDDQRRRRRLRRRGSRGRAGPEEHARPRRVDRGRLLAPLDARAAAPRSKSSCSRSS